MAAAVSARTGNRLLDILPARLRSDLIKASKTTELSFGTTIYRAGDVIRHVYFPISGYISLISPPSASEALEVGMIGSEGGFGVTVLLDTKTSPLRGLVQGRGSALRMSAEGLRRRVNGDPMLRRTLHRYLYVLMAQLAQTAACNRHHLLQPRLARWMLMTHDRALSNTFQLTHEFLALMLGVRRAGVTTAAHRLQDSKLITYRRGLVRVLDRTGLEGMSCPCYKALNAVYQQYLIDVKH